MRFLADLHLHSPFSRATSRDMTLGTTAAWAKIKGLDLLGTADFTHPEWGRRLRRELEPEGNGFFRLKKPGPPAGLPREFTAGPGDVRFVLSAELCFIYAKRGRVRKIHILLLVPGFATAEKIDRRLGRLGDLRADGRPILGLDAAAFARMAAEADPGCLVIPAHVWTPWFSLLGSRSGFDSVDECFEDMTPFVPALETGLSADPPMLRRISSLDRFAAISSSDAHSPSRLGREATAFDADFSFRGLSRALRGGGPDRILYTVEFHPEEGKYYADGHRKCGVVVGPGEAGRREALCPVCGKALTPGVRRRVEELADRPARAGLKGAIPSRRLIPLEEILLEAGGGGRGEGTIRDRYLRLVREFGNEHRVLTDIPAAELCRAATERLARGVERARRGAVDVTPGYDGKYGRARVFGGPERPAARPLP